MPVPSAITDISQTPGSNSPAGSESPALLDDYIRTVFAFIAELRDGQGFSNPVDLASAATTDIGAQTSPVVRITGTTTITSFGADYAGPRFLVFGGALTLTHNATSLILPGGANITTAAGDCAVAVPNLATPTGWRVVSYFPAALVPGSIVGTLPVSKGGTGATDAATARTNLGITNGTVGEIAIFPATSAPTGWLKANGASLSRTTYDDLWTYAQASGNLVSQGSKAKGNFGTGDGSTTFTLPDLRGEHLRFLDDGAGVDSGRAIGSFQDSQNKSHRHNMDYALHQPTGSYVNRVGRVTTDATSAGSAGGETVGMALEGGAEVRVRTIALLACIKH